MSSEERFNLTSKGKAYLDSLESSPTKPRKPDEVDRIYAEEVDELVIKRRIRYLMARDRKKAFIAGGDAAGKFSVSGKDEYREHNAWKQYRKETRRK